MTKNIFGVSLDWMISKKGNQRMRLCVSLEDDDGKEDEHFHCEKTFDVSDPKPTWEDAKSALLDWVMEIDAKIEQQDEELKARN